MAKKNDWVWGVGILLLVFLGLAVCRGCLGPMDSRSEERRIEDLNLALQGLENRVAALDAALKRETKARVALEQRLATLQIRSEGVERGK